MHTDGSPAPSPFGGLGRLRKAYLGALVAPDAQEARSLVAEALESGVGADRIYLQVLHPAMHDIGRLWERAQLSVAQEHLATQITQSVLAQIAHELVPGRDTGRGRTALAACTPGERHVLGAQMVADFLEADGWRAEIVPAGATADELARRARDTDATLVALSTALPHNLLAAAHAFSVIRHVPHRPLLIAGGQAYGGDAERARVVGADAFAADPEALLAIVVERLAIA